MPLPSLAGTSRSLFGVGVISLKEVVTRIIGEEGQQGASAPHTPNANSHDVLMQKLIAETIAVVSKDGTAKEAHVYCTTGGVDASLHAAIQGGGGYWAVTTGGFRVRGMRSPVSQFVARIYHVTQAHARENDNVVIGKVGGALFCDGPHRRLNVNHGIQRFKTWQASLSARLGKKSGMFIRCGRRSRRCGRNMLPRLPRLCARWVGTFVPSVHNLSCAAQRIFDLPVESRRRSLSLRTKRV